MKAIIAAVLSAAAVAGCATSKQIHTPSGDLGYTINCSGMALTWGACFEKAGSICGERGYRILARSGAQGTTLAANQFGLYGGSTMTRSMVIACK